MHIVRAFTCTSPFPSKKKLNGNLFCHKWLKMNVPCLGIFGGKCILINILFCHIFLVFSN